MNNKISVVFNKYLVSTLIAVFGAIMVVVGFRSSQETLFMVAAVNILIGGLLALLFSAGVLKRNIIFAIGFICIAFTVGFAIQSYKSVQATIKHNEDRKISESLVRFSLTQIRDMQRAHRSRYGRYAANWDELETFFKEGKVEVIESEKSVPTKRLSREEVKIIYGDNRPMDRNMNEEEAAKLASLGNPTNNPDLVGFKRDTVFKSYNEKFLHSISRINERRRLGLGEFNFEELKYIPMTKPKELWKIETRDSVEYNKDTIPTIRVEGLEPIPLFQNSNRQIVGFGNISTNSDKASWE